MATHDACVVALVVALTPACASLQDSATARLPATSHERSTLPKHAFRKGEVFNYIFENTEARYATAAGPATARPTDLTSLEEISVSVRVDIVGSGSVTTKRVTLTNVSYRKKAAADLSSGQFVEAETPVPAFHQPLSYTYQVSRTDGEVESQLASLFGDVRTTEIGSFLYYKMQDFHAFQGSADTLGDASLERSCPRLTHESDILLADGVFHNAKNLAYYQRDITFDRTRHAYVKSAVMGNWYEGPRAAPQTSYQYAFLVPLEGRLAGIVTLGTMDETIYITDPGTKAVSIIQRMVSLNLVADRSLLK